MVRFRHEDRGFARLALGHERDIAIDNVTCDAKNRQGISVIDVVGLAVTNSAFTNTEGTEPESGVDFEPFRTYHRMQGVTMRDCVFSGNHGTGIQYGGVDLDASSPPCDILIERATVFGNSQNPNRTRAGVDVNHFNRDNQESSRGTFTVLNTVIRDERASGINVRQYANGLDVLFDDIFVDNAANDPPNRFAAPIIVQPRSYDAGTDTDPCFGGVEFRNVRLRDGQQFFNGEVREQVVIAQLDTDLAGPADVTGDICVETPFPFSAFRAPEPCANVTLDITACTAPVPLDLLSFAGACDDDGAHVLTWDIADATELLGFTLETSGTGEDDWTTAATLTTADTYARAAFAKTVNGAAARYYRLVSRFVDGGAEVSPVVYVKDCGGAAGSGASLRVFPDPTRGILSFEPAATSRTRTLTDAIGRVVRRAVIPAGQSALDLDGLSPGLYALTEEGRGRNARVVVE